MTDQPTHSPGPWRVDTEADGSVWVIMPDGHDALIASRNKYSEACNVCPTCHANAALIARAPELLAENERLRAVCRRLIDYRDRAGALGFQLEKADDIINEIRMIIDGYGELPQGKRGRREL